MPPRYAYWTILIDDKPTAFRAREREELQPTFVQLQRKNANVTMQWFARGKLWSSREAEREDFQLQKHAASAPRERRAERPEGTERRGSDWRPGGAHKDPRDRFKKKNRPERAWSEKDPATQRDRDKPGYASKRNERPAGRPSADRPPAGGWRDKPAAPPRGDRPWSNKPAGEGKRPWNSRPPDRSGPPRERKPWNDKPAGDPRRNTSDPRATGGGQNDRPWQTKPTGPRAQRKPWVGKPGPPGDGTGFKPRGDRPWSPKPPGGASSSHRPWNSKPPSGEKRPWSPKPPGAGDRPQDPRRASSDRPPSGAGWSGRPPSGDRRPWSGKPRGDKPGGFVAGGPPRGDQKPWQKKPFRPSGPPRPDARRSAPGPRKRRDDEPPDRD